MHVDYIGYGRPKFEGEEEFFEEIFAYVNDKNFIDINENLQFNQVHTLLVLNFIIKIKLIHLPQVPVGVEMMANKKKKGNKKKENKKKDKKKKGKKKKEKKRKIMKKMQQ